jgi:PKD repeat protein
MQLQQEVAQVITANSLPKGLSDVYFLFLPPGVDSCDANNTSSCSYNVYCAYHSHFPEGGPTAGTVLYADQPFTGPGCSHSERPNGEPSDADSQLSVLSHEHIETVTDPLGTGWWDSATGDEIADKCINYGAALGGTAGARFNQVIAGNDYYLQQEWSNADNACAQRANKPPHAVISFQPQNPDPNAEVMFDGTASSDPDGTISTDPDAYTWTFGDGTAAAVGPTLRHTYTRNGVYTVTLVVKDDLGFTGTTSVSLRVGPPPPPPPVDQPPSCTASSATVAEGSSVAVSLTCSDPDGDTLSRTVTAPPAHGVLGDVDQSTGMVFYSPDPGYSGPDSFQFAADDGRGGVAPSATASISVEPPPSSPPPPTTPGPTAPSNPIDEPPLFADVASLSVKPRSFRAARSGPSAAASSGAAVRFVLEGTFGQVEFRIQRVVPGVRTAGGKCVKRSASTRRHSPCPLLVSVPGSFARPGVEGASTFRFTGRLQGRTLSPGTYRLRAAAGTGGITARASFVILH